MTNADTTYFVTYDDTAGVYELWADDTCAEHLGNYDTSREAHEAGRKALQQVEG